MSLAAITLWAVFQGLLLPRSDLLLSPLDPPSVWYTENYLLALYYAMLFGASILSGLYIGDIGKTLLTFFGSYLTAGAIIFEVFYFPGLVSADISFREGLAKISLLWTFATLFPFPLMLGMLGGIFGASLQETVVG